MKEFDENLIAWFRYLFWADINYKQLNKSFEASVTSEEIPTNLFIAFSSQWYGSLYVVVEGWEELKLEDQIISKLLNEHQDLKDLLRRYRNAVFHFQPKLLDNRLTGFGKTKDNSHLWIELLHRQFVRFFSDQVAKLPGDKDQQSEIKDSLKELIGWIPEGTFYDRVRDLNRLLEASDVLLKEGSGSTEEARELQKAIEQAKGLMVKTKGNYKQYLDTSIESISNG